MNFLKVTVIVLLAVCVKCQRYRQPGGWGSRHNGNGQGNGFHNQNGWGQRGNNNGYNHNGYQHNGHGPQQSKRPESVSCHRPVFTDDAKLEIDKCEQEPFHNTCWDSSSKIPSGWKVVMDCRKGSSIVQYPSTCSNTGEWSPQLQDNCDALIKHVQLKPLMNGGQCTMLQIQLSENFIFACFFPDSPLESADCHALKKVPSGTIAMLKCKPPFQSEDGRSSEWTCNEGSWKGDFNHRLKCYYSTQLSNSNDHLPTLRPIVQTTTAMPIWKMTTTHPLTNLRTTPKPITQKSATHAPTALVIIPPSIRTTTKAPTRKPKPPAISPSVAGITCPALRTRSPGIKLECVSKSPSGSEISLNSCNVPQPIGSEASYSCKQYYESTAGLVTLYRRCKDNGTFTGSSESFNCIVQCGRNNPVFVPFITSGTPSFRGQWPWHSAIFLKEQLDTSIKWTYICGGTLISPRAILTASHCVTFVQSAKVRDPSSFRLDLGRYERETMDDIVQTRQVSSIFVHPSYSPFGYDSDIAIVILKDEVTIGYHVRPICFPQTLNSALEELQLSESSVGTVAGWGYNENSELANELQMAELKVASQKECSDSARGIETGSIQAKSTTYCARSKNGSADVNVCNGDSGGGMYFPLKNSDFTRWYIQGIVSVGVADENGKCKPSQYSIFTRVGRYIDWIVRVLSENDAL